jgi:hypothetical protein
MKKSILLVCLLILAASSTLAANTLIPLDRVPAEFAPRVDLQAALLEDEADELAGIPPRFAIPNLVEITPDTHGLWERLDDDTLVWRLQVASQDAVSLNLGFKTYFMPEGGQLRIYSADGSQSIRPFTSVDNASHGELWTPVLLSDSIVVELTIPENAVDDLQLKLDSINVGYRGFQTSVGVKSGSCNVDVVCSQGDDWRNEIPSVAVISRGGSRNCTGFMVNNTANDQRPFFMTAHHCGYSSSSAAASLVAYWNYETSSCGGTPNGSLSDFSTGAFYRASYSPSDFTLMELDSDPDPAFGVTFAGWNATGADASSAVAIHHPSVDEKRISFEDDPTTTTSYLGSTVPGNGTHVRVTDWDLGTTEGGSSGSPLFNQNHQVIGQLHGGYASCSSQTSDWYGKFSVSWTGGGTNATSLEPWLDYTGTGELSVNTLGAGGGCESDAECDDGVFCNGPETCSASGVCTPGKDPCPGEDCDEAGDVCVPLACNNNSVCDPGEDCITCPNDCIGKQNGNPNSRYCCGDGTCEKAEDSQNCAVDCGAPAACGDAVCDLSEDSCSCPGDCGPPDATETSCTNGIDDDCNGMTDCADAVCTGDTACPSCLAQDEPCTSNKDCCSNSCRGRGGSKTCL